MSKSKYLGAAGVLLAIGVVSFKVLSELRANPKLAAKLEKSVKNSVQYFSELLTRTGVKA